MTNQNSAAQAAIQELKPCPFCGGPVELENTINSRSWWGVVCRNTRNRGGTCAIQTRPSASKEVAIERWNMRAPVADERAAFEAWATAIAEKYDVTRNGDHYMEPYTEWVWEAWQALAALASAPVAGEARMPPGYRVKVVEGHGYRVTAPSGSGWVAHNDTPAGDLIAALLAAPQASALAAEYTRGRADGFDAGQSAALEKAAQVAYEALHPTNPRSDWTEYAEHSAQHAAWAARSIRALKSQADKDGGQQRAGDADAGRLMAAAKGMTRLWSYVWDRTDGCLVVFPENVRAFDAAFDDLRIATGEVVDDDAPQAEQGERDA
ncbi:Lar family restriction alleviation protein [Achromobacter xylosoxidans]|uniref:Lar family restriction alleviation protein n=1 Tax=Alcaligenes xylosoxydans xylosoxydans TaxID=85698 RepID=UPI0012AA44B6|nr:Lar family restriction alleviation protein [Achromobacter xylosoxidans]CUR70324.1 restriction alleviation protein, Lar family [Achromobacter xylosoxidans]